MPAPFTESAIKGIVKPEQVGECVVRRLVPYFFDLRGAASGGCFFLSGAALQGDKDILKVLFFQSPACTTCRIKKRTALFSRALFISAVIVNSRGSAPGNRAGCWNRLSAFVEWGISVFVYQYWFSPSMCLRICRNAPCPYGAAIPSTRRRGCAGGTRGPDGIYVGEGGGGISPSQFGFRAHEVYICQADDHDVMLAEVPAAHGRFAELVFRHAVTGVIVAAGGGKVHLLLHTFIPSVLNTIEIQYNYHLYIGYDRDDPCYIKNTSSSDFRVYIKTNVLYGIDQRITAIWNILAAIAYKDDCDYFYPANDDLQLRTKGWTSAAIQLLQSCGVASNFGIVAFRDISACEYPTFHLTHRKHLDLHDGIYYP
ncbi:unnamed protein product, partial [Adineta ricciae]